MPNDGYPRAYPPDRSSDFSGRIARRRALAHCGLDYDPAVLDIATRPGAHCAPRLHQALGTTEQGAVRFSFSWFNTEAEIDEAIRAVEEISA